jgi:hypothetical protein
MSRLKIFPAKPVSKLAISVELAQTSHELRPAFKPVLNLTSPKQENTISTSRGTHQSKISHNARSSPKSR